LACSEEPTRSGSSSDSPPRSARPRACHRHRHQQPVNPPRDKSARESS
jgi:hypothetical protein